MRRPFLLAFAVLGACAQPVPRRVAAPAPIMVPNYPLVLQSSGPDGESPPPSAPPVPPGVSLAAMGNGNAERMRDFERLRDRHLVVPVTGVSADHLQDTFYEGRDGGRQHNAIDILAPRNTPIVAADDGEILRMSSNTLGGITIYATDTDHRFVYYYAHLDHYDGSAFAGRKITKGDTLGYVGTTGNAPKDTPHLHFQIMRWPADGKYWFGEPVDPYPFLHASR